MLKRICLILCFVLFIPNVAYANQITVSASSSVAIDSLSNEILYENNAKSAHSMASTTKIMTCIIACESNKLDDVVTITAEMLDGAIGSLIYLTVGDTITLAKDPAKQLSGYKTIKPMVFCGLYPVDSNDYLALKEALEKLCLNDASLQFIPETSQALGFGFRCGFLGLLHMDVVQERLEREYGLDLILTAPSVIYHVNLTDGTQISIDNPSKLPDMTHISSIEEPYVSAEIMTPKEYVGPIMELCQDRRGIYHDLEYFDDTRMILHYELPLSEIVYNFFDQLKSFTKGYASFDYQYSDYKVGNLQKLDILLNGQIVDALSSIVYKPSAYNRGLGIIRRIKETIPRQQFEIPIQASIAGKIIARVDVKAVRKDVLAKCYGGDISRKKKLLEKQKEGKKRMKKIGSVEVPQDAFMSILSIGDDE